MSKKQVNERIEIYNKYDGRCAYCGEKIEYKDMQVDHVVSVRAGGSDGIDNKNPSCRLCNHYKRASSLEGFRMKISKIHNKLLRDSYIYKVGLKYNLIVPMFEPIEFYFEKYKKHIDSQN